MIKINYPDKYIGTEIEAALLEFIANLNGGDGTSIIDVPKGIVLPYGCDIEMFDIEEIKLD